MVDIHDTLKALPALAGARVLSVLKGGVLSKSWLLENARERLVLRVDTAMASRLGMDRRAELDVLNAVSAAGIGPQVFWADPDRGILVTCFVEGRVGEARDMTDATRLRALAGVLKRLYALPPAGPRFDPGRYARAYARLIGTQEALEQAATIERLASVLDAGSRQVICHGDLTHSNIIGLGSSPVKLIDWEFAAVGDPLFDLSVLACHYELPWASMQVLINEAMGELVPLDWERFEAWCSLYQRLERLWELAVSERV